MSETQTWNWRQSFVLKRLPLFVALGGAVLLFTRSPREVEMVYDISARREGLKTVTVKVAAPGEAPIRRSDFMRSTDEAWPSALSHTVKLSPGRYHVAVTLSYRDRPEVVVNKDVEVTTDTDRFVFLSGSPQ